MTDSHYYPPLVLASFAVAMLASYVWFSLAERVQHSTGNAARLWIGGGAIAMGISIWSMHFIGMLAFRMPIAMGFDLGLTGLSLLLPIVASAIALWQLSQPELPPRRLLVGALLMGAGINAMHYTGMAAMQMSPPIQYEPILFGTSVVIAVVAAGAAIWTAFHLFKKASQVWIPRLGGAVLMGIAIAGMHYTAMAAAIFDPDSVCLAAGRGVNQDILSVVVAISTTGILLVVLITSEMKARLETKEQALVQSNADIVFKQEMLDQEHIARELAERTNQQKDEFLAMLSHELRTPLSSIAGWTEILRRGIDDASMRDKAIESISRNVRIQTQLINELLDVSRIISGKIVLDLQPVDLNALLLGTLDSIRPSADEKKLRLALQLPRKPIFIDGDKTRLAQIFSNLLTNAVKFTPEAGAVTLSLAISKGSARVTVTDTGTGISPRFLPHVFERFRQEDSSATRKYGGLGLGLSIVHDLVLQHGGTISAESAGENRGATFIVTLPVLATLEDYENSTQVNSCKSGF